MEIYLIRHTSPKIEQGICYGQTDVLLDLALFKADFEQIKKALPNDIEHVYSSPLQRCKILANKLSDNVTDDNCLMELDFGDWEMQKWTDLEGDKFNAWMENFVQEKTQNGESYTDLHHRMSSFLANLNQQNHKKIAVVTHAGNIRSAISYLLDLPLINSFRIAINYGAIIKIELNENNNLNKLISIQNG